MKLIKGILEWIDIGPGSWGLRAGDRLYTLLNIDNAEGALESGQPVTIEYQEGETFDIFMGEDTITVRRISRE